MRRRAFLCVPALIVAACASSNEKPPNDEKPLIMDASIAQIVRTAGTCFAFNGDVERYVFGVQLEMKNYAEAAAFWKARFEKVEPDPVMRERLMDSARKRMDTDFPRRGVPAGAESTRFEVFNSEYSAVISMCESERESLETSSNG